MTALDKVRFREELKAMPTEELQLVLTDQRDLYSDEELRLVLAELSDRPDIKTNFNAEEYVPCEQEEPPAKEKPAKREKKARRGSKMAPLLELFALLVSIAALVWSGLYSVAEKNWTIFLITLGSAIVLLLLFFSAAEALRSLADISDGMNELTGARKKK